MFTYTTTLVAMVNYLQVGKVVIHHLVGSLHQVGCLQQELIHLQAGLLITQAGDHLQDGNLQQAGRHITLADHLHLQAQAMRHHLVCMSLSIR